MSMTHPVPEGRRPEPVTVFGPDFPFAYDDWLAHPFEVARAWDEALAEIGFAELQNVPRRVQGGAARALPVQPPPVHAFHAGAARPGRLSGEHGMSMTRVAACNARPRR
jgi:hypothetical protein